MASFWRNWLWVPTAVRLCSPLVCIYISNWCKIEMITLDTLSCIFLRNHYWLLGWLYGWIVVWPESLTVRYTIVWTSWIYLPKSRSWKSRWRDVGGRPGWRGRRGGCSHWEPAQGSIQNMLWPHLLAGVFNAFGGLLSDRGRGGQISRLLLLRTFFSWTSAEHVFSESGLAHNKTE